MELHDLKGRYYNYRKEPTMPKYPLPTLVWVQLAFPEILTKREREKIAKRIDSLLAQGIVPEAGDG